MICPNKICQKEIPSDSVFCDQCGVHLRQCTKCGSIVLSKFCNTCGGVVIDRVAKADSNASTAVSNIPNMGSEQEQQGTMIIESIPELKLISDTFSLNIKSGDLLGRTLGEHSAYLGKFPVISSKHAKIELVGKDWVVTDLHSTNKTFLNGKQLSPDVAIKINDKDSLVLANVKFMVNIK